MLKVNIHSDEAAEGDRLDRKTYAKALAHLATTCDTPLVIGLYGTWGIGKTTLMEFIKEELEVENIFTVWFNAWQHQFDKNPPLALLHQVGYSCGMKQKIKKLLTVIAATFGGMLLKTTTNLKVEDIDTIGKRFEEEHFQVREHRIRLREYFEQVINEARGGTANRIVFFIDDLDRCMPPQTLAVLEALKLYLNFKGCVFFLGVDRLVLERSIRQHYKDLEVSEVSYLDKIVQLPFNIPPIAPPEMETFVEHLLSDELKQCHRLLVNGLGDNPRHVKRFINVLALNHQLATSKNIRDYDPMILAVLLLIQYRSPSFYRRIAKDTTLLQKLQRKEDETSSLYEEYLASDERLKGVVYAADLSTVLTLEPYVYLAQVAGIIEQKQTKRREINLQDVLLRHEMWLNSAGKEGTKANLQNVDLREASLRNIDLSDADLSLADLTEADLRGATMRHVNLRDADLIRVKLRGANLRDADLCRAAIEGGDLAGVDLQGAILKGTNLKGANLVLAKLSGADLTGADITKANMEQAYLDGVKGLTREQIGRAITNEETQLPEYILDVGIDAAKKE